LPLAHGEKGDAAGRAFASCVSVRAPTPLPCCRAISPKTRTHVSSGAHLGERLADAAAAKDGEWLLLLLFLPARGGGRASRGGGVSGHRGGAAAEAGRRRGERALLEQADAAGGHVSVCRDWKGRSDWWAWFVSVAFAWGGRGRWRVVWKKSAHTRDSKTVFGREAQARARETCC
jgi:hypothetical protein